MIILFLAFYLLDSCKKEETTTSSSTSNTNSNNNSSVLEKSYISISGTGNFYTYGPPCWPSNTNWCCSGSNTDIFCQNGVCWIDSLSYVIKEKLPITINNASFTFNDYVTSNGAYHILSGTGYLYNDTLSFTAYCVTGTTGCTPGTAFTMKGKYKVVP